MFGKNKKPKSPIKIVRDIKTINHEYGALCGELGDIQYKIEGLKKSYQERLHRMDVLVEEHKAAQAEIDRKAQAAAKVQVKDETAVATA